MKCDKQCSYRTPYGYCSVTQCQRNLGTTYAEPRHLKRREKMIDGYDDNFSTTDKSIYVKPASINPPNIYIKGKWLDEKKDQYANVFIDDKPLIRCKDCKYSTDTDDAYRLRVCRRMCGLSGFTDYDFCSKGVKKDD